MRKKPNITQYNLEYPTDAGLRARLGRLLARERVDLRSLIETRSGARTLIQFLAPQDDGLRDRIERLGVTVREELIFQVEVPNHHWELHKLAKTLADKDINILSLYTKEEGESLRIVLAVDQPANAVALMEKLGLDPDYAIYE